MTLRHKTLALALLAAPLLFTGCSSIRAKAAFQDGNKAYKEENYKTAITYYEKAVQYDPQMAEAWFYLANSNQALYRPNKPGADNKQLLATALEQYKKSLEVNQANTENLKRVRANTLAVLVQIHSDDPYKDYTQAQGYAQELVKDNPEDPRNLYALGALYEKFEKYAEGEDAYRKAVEVTKAIYEKADAATKEEAAAELVKAWNALATFYNKAYWDGHSRFDDAIAALEQAAELAPNDPVGYYKLATFYWDKAYRDAELNDEEKLAYALKGKAAVDQALGIDPDYCDALVYKGLLLRVEAQVAESRRQRARLLDEAEAVQKLAIECKKQATEGEMGAAPEPAED